MNVCPAVIKGLTPRRFVRASIDGAGLEQLIHREDVARFMVEQLTTDRWGRQSVPIGY